MDPEPRSQPSRKAPATSPRLLDIAAAAEVLGVSVASVRRLVATGRLPIVKLNRRLLVDSQDLDKLIEGSKERVGW